MPTCSPNFVFQTSFHRQLRFFARIISGFLVFAFLYPLLAQGQLQKLDLPAPKLEALEDIHRFTPFVTRAELNVEPNSNSPSRLKLQSPKIIRRSHFALDGPSAALGLVQGASELYDGVTTKYFLHHCSTCLEVDPVSHFLLGSKPTWTGMITIGSIEVIGTTYLHQSMRRSPHKFVRNSAPILPLVLIAIHLLEGSKNLTLKNEFYCTTPGYVVIANSCLPTTPTMQSRRHE